MVSSLDRETWRRVGAEGFLGANAPEEYGGAGGDFLFDVVLMEEMARIRAHAMMLSLHSDICMPYLIAYGNERQTVRNLEIVDIRLDENLVLLKGAVPGSKSGLVLVRKTKFAK